MGARDTSEARGQISKVILYYAEFFPEDNRYAACSVFLEIFCVIDFSDKELNRYFRYCLSLTGNREDAFDLLQGSVEKILRKESVDIQNPGAYFLIVIRNMFFDDLRKKSGQPLLEVFESHHGKQLSEDEDFSEILMQRDQLAPALEHLNSVDRELIHLTIVEGYTIDELSELTGVSRGTVLSKIHRAKIKLKKYIKRRNIAGRQG